ncbi:hypothetical protein PO909_029612 [Leuciscus waleckii]
MEFDYPDNCTSANTRKQHRKRTLRNNIHELYVDTSQQNLTFYTPVIAEWISTFCDEYKYVSKKPLDNGKRLTICNDQSLDAKKTTLTISCYNTGIVLVQSYEESLNIFQGKFPQLKARVEHKEDQTPVNSSGSVESPETSPPSTSDHQLTEEQQGPTEKRAEERDQPQTAAEENNLSITKLTTKFSELKSK